MRGKRGRDGGVRILMINLSSEPGSVNTAMVLNGLESLHTISSRYYYDQPLTVRSSMARRAED